VFKAGVFVLLIANTIVFYAHGTASEALDAIAWLTLLALFELETGTEDRLSTRGAVVATHAVRLCAGAGVAVAAAGYYIEHAWLDAANTSIWIAIVIVLELKVRFPEWFTRRGFTTGSIAIVLYSTLFGLVIAWAWRGEWFDAYDAALWIFAFATIEANIAVGLRANLPSPA